MEFAPDWAPNVHPMFVHFPIGLLMTAVALDALALLPKTSAIRRSVPVLYAAGAVSAIATYFTGQAAANGVVIPADAEPLLTQHADFALWTVLFFGTYALVRVAVARFLPNANLPIRLGLVMVAAVGLYLIWETAERGSEMVYVHSIGVAESHGGPDEYTEAAEASEPDASGDALHIHDGGWTLQPTSSSALTHARIRWLMGSPPHVTAQETSDGIVLELDGQSGFFVIEDTLENVQVSAELNRDEFSGSITLVHHFEDSSTFDYLAFTSDELRLGRLSNGSDQTFDRGSTTATGWMRVRVTGDGTHFRGYVDDRMIVHGHADALQPGMVGLHVDGRGTLRLRRLQARAL